MMSPGSGQQGDHGGGEGRGMRLLKALGFLMDAILGLVLSALFAMVVSGLPLVGKTGVVGVEVKSNNSLETLETALVYAKHFDLFERVLLIAIGLTLLRMLHSFFLLSWDDMYNRAMFSTDHNASYSAGRQAFLMLLPRWVRRWNLAVLGQGFSQFAVVVLCVASLFWVRPHGDWLPIWALLLWPVLGLCWDLPALPQLRRANTVKKSQHLTELTQTFDRWWKLDKFVILGLLVVLATGAILSSLTSMVDKETVRKGIELCTSIVLALAMFEDYRTNTQFYASDLSP